MMKRRDFLITSAMTMGAAATPGGWQTERPAESKADRIAIRAMFPYTDGNCHMKMHNPPTYDLPAAIALIKSLGYTGLYSIENEQQGDPYENVQRVYDLVVATI